MFVGMQILSYTRLIWMVEWYVLLTPTHQYTPNLVQISPR